MARAPTTRNSGPRSDNGFGADENAIAWLLAGYHSDRSTWSDHVATEVTNVRAMSLFFCPVMNKLRQRGKTIEKACNGHETHKALKVQRRPFNTLARGESVTLDGIMHVYRVLNAIADSDDEDIRATTEVERRGRVVCLALEENDVIPSHLWVNRTLITQFRSVYDIGRKKLAELMYGEDHYDDFFQALEEGEKADGTEYDFRVTPFTQQCLLFTLNAIYDRLPRSGENKDYALPSSGELFKSSSTAGLGAYNRTKALPIDVGNLTRPMTPEQRTAIEGRVKAYAKKSAKAKK